MKKKKSTKQHREKKAGKYMGKRELVDAIVRVFRTQAGRDLTLRYVFDRLHLNTHPMKMLCREILDELVADDYLCETTRFCYRLNYRGQEHTDTPHRSGGQHRNATLHRGDGQRRSDGRVDGLPIPAGDNDAVMHAILAEFGLPHTYPKTAEQAAERISADISAEEIARREDFRQVPTFTIDPADAKDFDDALSIRQLPDSGLWEVGVHIADVTHYIAEGSLLDREAQQRATSIYLVDRTIPMLPERLCNLICSLRPQEEKLTYSVVFDMDDEAVVHRSRIVHTVIRSDRRFSYEEAQAVIEGQQSAALPQPADSESHPETSSAEPADAAAASVLQPANISEPFAPELLTLDRLAKKLRQRRMEAGAINFDRVEVKFDVDEQGKPLRVFFKESKDANKLIEEFMLLANRTVAERIGQTIQGKKAKTFVYRIHDLPDPDKLDQLAQFIARFGYRLRTQGTQGEVAGSLNRLLTDCHGRREANLIETVALRAMQKARYSTHNIGHYGLAFAYYTHFTSPIRRYPDMMVHRLLTRYLEGGGRSVTTQKYEDLCGHSSQMEQLAANAERASVKYKQVEFMADRLGQIYDGVITNVTEWGLYVELNENKCEGLVPVRDLGDDYYDLDEQNFCLRGRRHGHRFTLGDPIQVRIARANLERKQLDFALID